MSIHLISFVFTRDFATAARKMLAVRLADHASDDGTGIYPGVPRLALECNMSERTIRRHLDDFVEMGLLILRHQGGTKGRKSDGSGDVSRYDMDLRVLAGLPSVHEHPVENEAAPEGETTSDTVKTNPDTVSPCQNDKVDNRDVLPGHGVTLTVIEPLPPLNPPLGGTDRSDPPPEPGGSIDRTDFEAVGATWPHWVTEDRNVAWREWAALDKTERRRAAAYVAPFLQEWEKRHGRSKRIWSFAKYLGQAPWRRVKADTSAKSTANAGRKTLPLFGPDWMFRLLEVAATAPKGEAGGEVRQYIGFSMQIDGARVPADWAAPDVATEAVKVDSARWREWRAAFGKAGLPWIDRPARQDYVHFPAGGPGAYAVAGDPVALIEGKADVAAGDDD